MWYLIKCDEDNSYSVIHDKYVMQGGADIEIGSSVTFFYGNKPFIGIVSNMDESREVVDQMISKLGEEAKRTSKKVTEVFARGMKRPARLAAGLCTDSTNAKSVAKQPQEASNPKSGRILAKNLAAQKLNNEILNRQKADEHGKGKKKAVDDDEDWVPSDDDDLASLIVNNNKKFQKLDERRTIVSSIQALETPFNSVERNSTASGSAVIPSPTKEELKKRLLATELKLQMLCDSDALTNPKPASGSKPNGDFFKAGAGCSKSGGLSVNESTNDASTMNYSWKRTLLDDSLKTSASATSPASCSKSHADGLLVNESTNDASDMNYSWKRTLDDPLKTSASATSPAGCSKSHADDLSVHESMDAASDKNTSLRGTSLDSDGIKNLPDKGFNDYDFDLTKHQLIGAGELDMMLLANNIYCRKSALGNALSGSTAVTHVARRIMEGVFKQEALENCTLTGQPYRAGGKDNIKQTEGLNKAAVDAIIAYAKEVGKKRGWSYVKSKTIKTAMTQRLGELKRKNK